MKKKCRALALLLSAALLLPLSACSGPGSAPAPTGRLLTQGQKPLSAAASYDAKAEEALKGSRDFALRLFGESLKSSPGENVLVSPLSISLALGMTANGAKGQTLEEFSALLGGDPETLNPAMAALTKSLLDTGGNTKLSLANSIWTREQDFTPQQPFLDAMAQYFGAEFFTADMESRDTVDQVNGWISQKTQGLIPQMLESISPDTVMLLVNALYMDAKWTVPFDPNNTYRRDFTQAGGTARETQFLHNGMREELYLQGEGFDGVLLPYDDKRLGFFALLPESGAPEDLAQSLDGAALKALLESAQTRPMTLALPKFKVEHSCELSELLRAMGLQSAFDTAAADLSGLGTGRDNIFISSVDHKTVLEVAEKGTVAAAATVVAAADGAALPPEDLVELTLDHPFLYGVVDLQSGTPLFLGVLNTVN